MSCSAHLKLRNVTTKVVEKIKIHVLCPITFFFENLATDDKMAHALCMLDASGYKHRFRICNTYCFSTTTVVTGQRL